MPSTWVVLFREKDDGVPLLDWLDGLPIKVTAKCQVRLERLQSLGHELLGLEADLCATAFMSCAWDIKA